MAASVSGVITLDNVQIDGRRIVHEIWTDDQGNNFNFDYMAGVGVDVNTVMAARSQQVLDEAIALQLKQAGG